MRRTGFTLVELLVSVTLFMLAVGIALAAVINSNNLIQLSDNRASLVDSVRDTSERLSNLTTGLGQGSIDLISGVSYANPNDDATLSFLPGQKSPLDTASTGESGFALEIRRYGTGLQDNVCYLIGRGNLVEQSSGDQVKLDENGRSVVVIVTALNVSSQTPNCIYSTLRYKGTLSSSGLSLVGLSFTLGDRNAQAVHLRYLMQIETASASRSETARRYGRLEAVYGLSVRLN